MIGKWAIGLYLGSTTLAPMYGTASSLMVILAWVYYSSLIFFLGAEFTSVYAHEYGSRAAQSQRLLLGLAMRTTAWPSRLICRSNP